MSERLERMLTIFAKEMEHQDFLNPAEPILIAVAAELDALEARIGSLKARPEEVAEWTDGAGVLETNASEERRERLRAFHRVHELMGLAEGAWKAGDSARYEEYLDAAEAETAKSSDWRIHALVQDFKQRHPMLGDEATGEPT